MMIPDVKKLTLNDFTQEIANYINKLSNSKINLSLDKVCSNLLLDCLYRMKVQNEALTRKTFTEWVSFLDVYTIYPRVIESENIFNNLIKKYNYTYAEVIPMYLKKNIISLSYTAYLDNKHKFNFNLSPEDIEKETHVGLVGVMSDLFEWNDKYLHERYPELKNNENSDA